RPTSCARTFACCCSTPGSRCCRATRRCSATTSSVQQAGCAATTTPIIGAWPTPLPSCARCWARASRSRRRRWQKAWRPCAPRARRASRGDSASETRERVDMRRVIWSLLIVSAAVGLAMLMRFNHGNIAVLWPPYRVDVSVNFAVLLLVVGFVVLHLLLVTLSNALNLPARVREYRERRRREAALAGLRDGLLALFEGRFGRAERLAQSALGDRSLAGVASLVAARAAHRMRETERRDRWLESAADEAGVANARLMTAAELAVEDHRSADAIEAIETLRSSGPRHIHALRIALRAHEQSQDWPALLQALRQIEKRDAMHPAAIRGLKIRAYRALFDARRDDASAVQQLYASLSLADRDIDEIVDAAAQAFAAAGRPDQAARMVEQVLE